MATTDQLLDLDSIGQRSSDVVFEVTDKSLQKIGEVQPEIGNVSITNDTNRAIKRTISSFTLTPQDRAAVDVFRDRIRPVWVLENGARFNLGVFVLASLDGRRHEWGLDANVTGVDQLTILDQGIEKTSGYSAGKPIYDALVEQFNAAGVRSFNVDPSITGTLANPISWPAGNTTRLTVMNDLCAAGGAYSVYFDNDGTGQARKVPDLSVMTPSLVYDFGGRIYSESMVESNDLLNTPNRYIVVDSGNPSGAIFGSFDVPDEAPFSAFNRDFVVAKVISEQGLTSSAEAVQRATTAYVQDSFTYEWVQFSGPPDPRHDTFDAVGYLGLVYREQQWQLPLTEGAEMQHDLRRTYTTL